MISFLTALSILVPGLLSAAALLKRFKLPCAGLLTAVLAFPMGCGLLSLILFFSFLAGGSNGPALTLILAALASLTFAILLWPESGFTAAAIKQKINNYAKSLSDSCGAWLQKAAQFKTLSATERNLFLIHAGAFAVLIVVLIHYWVYFWGQVSWSALGGWDARYFWKLKARFFYRDPSEWLGMFSPVPGSWSHPDYPLMLPGSFAWAWIITGRETLISPIIVSLGFSLSLIGLVFWYLKSYVAWSAACLGSAFLMTVSMWRFWSTTLYADIPLTFFMTAAGIFLVLALRLRDSAFLIPAGLFAGLSLWTKDEGLLFSGWLLLLIVFTQWQITKNPKTTLHAAAGFFAALLLPLSAVILIKGFLGTTGGQYLGSGRTLSDFLNLVFGNFEKTKLIGAVFGIFAVNHAQWNGLWILAALAGIAGGKKAFEDSRWIFAVLILLLWSGYFLILHVTPLDLRFQIETALLRIMSHAMGFGVLFLGEALFRKNTPARVTP